MENTYTINLENSFFSLLPTEDDINSEEVLQFLNRPESFRNFGEGLKEIIKKKYGDKDYRKFLLESAKNQGIILNRNTVKNWFEGNRPKKGEQSREHMFLVSFALHLNLEETYDLFRKVYLDRPFNFRDPKEVIYYYCIDNEQDYLKAQELIARLQIDNDSSEETIATRFIEKDIELMKNESDLLDYIKVHSRNFQISKISAKETLSTLIERVKASDGDKEKFKSKKVDQTCSYTTRECYMREELLDENKDLSSISTMLAIIEGGDLVNTRKEQRNSVFKNANLPQEIINRFPTKHTFTNEDPTFEELRKMIILLYSYELWFGKQYENEELDFDDYIITMNDILADASLQTLYYGNPYDWLFLYCTLTDAPLDVFRDIMAEAIWNQ